MIQPPKAAPIPDGMKAGLMVTDEHVLVSVRRECVNIGLATKIALHMVQAVESVDHPYDEDFRAAGVEEEQ